MAVQVNNQLASDIANNTERFGGFAALAMHNATIAALELKRTVEELGFIGVFLPFLRVHFRTHVRSLYIGALLNDYQQSGADGREFN